MGDGRWAMGKDSRNLVTLPRSEFEHYALRAFADGHYELYPRVLTDPTIGRGTLEMIDEAMANVARGEAGAVVGPDGMLASLGSQRRQAAPSGRKRARS